MWMETVLDNSIGAAKDIVSGRNHKRQFPESLGRVRRKATMPGAVEFSITRAPARGYSVFILPTVKRQIKRQRSGT